MNYTKLVNFKPAELLTKVGKFIWDNIFDIFLLLSLGLNFYFSIQYAKNEAVKDKIKDFQEIAIETNSMAVESAYTDSIAYVIQWWINN